MDNHVHFVALPRKADTLARVFSTAHMRYSQYFNKKRKASGHLWQGRFYSCLLDEPYLMAAMRYTERNPVRAQLVKKPWQWEWSSAAAHIGQADGIVDMMDLKEFLDISPESWKEFIDSPEQEEGLRSIRHHTMTGRPLGRESFVTKIGRKLGRRLVALPRGRPKIQIN